MITPEQIADLRPGDVVEITWSEDTHPDVKRSIQGPIRKARDGYFYVGSMVVRGPDGDAWGSDVRTLTVVCRAPRPLYVNHDRAEPVPGDVAKDADGHEPSGHTWHYLGDEELGGNWWRFDGRIRNATPKRLRLLVDGETGQVVR